MTKQKAKKYLLLFTVFVLAIAALFYLYLHKKNTGPILSANTSFAEFTETMFKNELSQNTLNLHYTLSNPNDFGITNPAVSLGDYSGEAISNSYAALENYSASLKSYEYKDLSLPDQQTYDILKFYLDGELSLAKYELYDEPLSPAIGTQAQLPVLLAEYSFQRESDITTYLELLSMLDDYYSGIAAFEKRKSEAGLFMADYAADDIIAQCQEFISNPETNFLITVFNSRIDNFPELSIESKESYIAQNQSIVLEDVIPAYEILINELTSLKGTGKNEQGLCYYPEGKEYYEQLVRFNTGSSRSVKELKKLLESQMDKDFKNMAAIINNKPSIAAMIDSYDFPDMEPMNILQDLQNKMLKDFPVAPETAYMVKFVDPSLENHLSPAFYLTPPIDNMSENVIYINPASNYNKLSLYTTLAHEGYPGHLYQTIFSNSANLPHIRSLLNFGGYIEGWATYVEMYSYGLADMDSDLASLLQINSSITLSLYANIDIGIHYDKWSLEDTRSYLANFSITSEDVAQTIYRSIVEEPSNYLKYFIGYLEFLSLRDKAQSVLKDSFVLKDFHEFILTVGPAPFEILENYLDIWAAQYKE